MITMCIICTITVLCRQNNNIIRPLQNYNTAAISTNLKAQYNFDCNVIGIAILNLRNKCTIILHVVSAGLPIRRSRHPPRGPTRYGGSGKTDNHFYFF